MNVVVVTGICVERDAISAAVAGQAEVLASLPGIDRVTVVAEHIDRALTVDHAVVADPWSLLRHEAMSSADVAIFHWGIRYGLFDALSVVAQQRRAVVHFHNVTPPELAPPDRRDVLVASRVQIELPELTGTPYWTESPFNERTLVEWGVDPARIRFMPFPIDAGGPERSLRSADDPVGLLCVGRLVHSKGTDVLIEAFVRAHRLRPGRLRLDLVGSTELSDAVVRQQLADAVRDADCQGAITVHDDLTDEALWDAFVHSDVVVSPSFHEGLCVPVLEGYLAGCRAIVSDAGNLPNLVHPPDHVVPAGDVGALAAAIVAVHDEISAGLDAPPPASVELALRYSRSATAAELRTALGELASRAPGESPFSSSTS